MKKILSALTFFLIVIVSTTAQDYPWLWPTHKNWIIASNLFTGQLIDMKAGTQKTIGSPFVPVQQLEGSSVASDDNGNFLFYTNGRVLYTKSADSLKIVYNGLLAGNENGSTGIKTSASQGVIITRHPLSTEKYYIFTTDDFLSSTVGLNYFVFDKQGNNLLPVGPNRLGNYRTSEGIAATRHANGVDIWITVLNIQAESFYSYRLGNEGLDTTPVISAIGPKYYNQNQEVGCLSFSYDGKHFTSTNGVYQYGEYLTLYDFDNSNGTFSNIRKIGFNSISPHDVIFSPEGSKIYTFEFQGKISSYDISDLNLSDSAIAATRKEINTTSNDNLLTMEYAADGNLYLAGGLSSKEMTKIEGDFSTGNNLSVYKVPITNGSRGLPTMYIPPVEFPTINAQSSVCLEDGHIDISTKWAYSKIDAENTKGLFEYNGFGIIDSKRGIFDPALAGVGVWRIYFLSNLPGITVSDSIDITVTKCITSLSTFDTKHTVTVVPNPAIYNITLQSNFKNYNNCIATIYSSDGRTIGSYNINHKKEALPISHLKKGCYFILLQNEAGHQLLDFIKL